METAARFSALARRDLPFFEYAGEFCGLAAVTVLEDAIVGGIGGAVVWLRLGPPWRQLRHGHPSLLLCHGHPRRGSNCQTFVLSSFILLPMCIVSDVWYCSSKPCTMCAFLMFCGYWNLHVSSFPHRRHRDSYLVWCVQRNVKKIMEKEQL